MSTQAVSRSANQFIVRFPEGMRDELKVRAAQNRRSMNAEIVTILEMHLPKTETAEHSAKSASAA